MSTRIVCRARSNQWRSSFVASSAASFSVSTDDPAQTVMAAPMPTLTLGFRSSSAVPFILAPPVVPAALSAIPRYAPAPPPPLPLTPLPETLAPPPEASPPENSAPEPGPAEPGPTEPSPAEPSPPEHSNRIELIIDSLPNHMLSEPIPVWIEPLDDDVFTAKVCNLDISASGSGVGEALLVLKEQVEYIYEDLSKRQDELDADQKAMLQTLHTYIAPQPSKVEWL